MDSICDTSKALDINSLNEVASILQSQHDGAISLDAAQEILEAFQKREDLTNYLIPILESDSTPYTKYFAVRGLRHSIKVYWNVIDEELKDAIKGFLFSFIQTISQQSLPPFLIHECNQALVDIINVDWPEKWPSFMTDLIESAKQNPNVCTNAFDILQLISEIINESEKMYITMGRSIELICSITNHIQIIMELIDAVLKEPYDQNQAKEAIQCLIKFVDYVDLPVLIESNIILATCEKYINEPQTCVPVIDLLAHFLSHPTPNSEYDQYFETIFDTLVSSLYEISGEDFTKSPDLLKNDAFQESLVNTMSSFLLIHIKLFKDETHQAAYFQMLRWLFVLTSTESESLFSSLIEFWMHFLRKIFMETRSSEDPLPEFFIELFAQMRRLLLFKMPTPFVEHSVINRNGREHTIYVKNYVLGSVYASARETLVFLTNFDQEDMIDCINESFQQIQSNAFDGSHLSSLCWATSAIAESLPLEISSTLFPVILQYLFELNESLDDFQDKIIIAKGICFLSSHFYKFLQIEMHFVVLKAVYEKMCEFLLEEDQGLQVFAIQSMMFLAQRCKPSIINVMPDNDKSLLRTILENIDEFLGALSLENVPEFYRLLAILIQGCFDSLEGITRQWLWDNVLEKIHQLNSEAEPSIELYEHEIAYFKSLTNLIIYFRQTIPLQPDFISSIIDLYIQLSQQISEHIMEDSLSEMGILILTTKSKVLKFFYHMINFCNISEVHKTLVTSLVFGPVLDDYNLCPPFARSPNVLSLVEKIIKRLNIDDSESILMVFEKLLIPTFKIFDSNEETNEKFKLNFVRLIHCITEKNNLLNIIPPEVTGELLHYIEFGCKQTNQLVSDNSVFAFCDLIRRASNGAHSDEVKRSFLEENVLDMISFAFNLVTDITYKFSFGIHVNTLRDLLLMDFVKERADAVYLRITDQYPNRPPEEILELLKKIMDSSTDINMCKDLLRSFVVNVTKISPNDNDLYKAEREEYSKELLNVFKESIPGYVSHVDLPMDKPVLELAQNMSSITII